MFKLVVQGNTVVRDCNWQWDEQLAEIQAVNGGKALNSEADKDAAFAAAARQIKQAISLSLSPSLTPFFQKVLSQEGI